MARDYGTAPPKVSHSTAAHLGMAVHITSMPKTTPVYTPPSTFGAEHGPDQGPVARRSLHSQVLGSVVGRRGAGITTLAGGDPAAHSVNHYGKQGLPGLDGGDFGGGF